MSDCDISAADNVDTTDEGYLDYLIREKEAEFINTYVHFKGKFLKPKGGYVITEHDKENTKYCIDRYIRERT